MCQFISIEECLMFDNSKIYDQLCTGGVIFKSLLYFNYDAIFNSIAPMVIIYSYKMPTVIIYVSLILV